MAMTYDGARACRSLDSCEGSGHRLRFVVPDGGQRGLRYDLGRRRAVRPGTGQRRGSPGTDGYIRYAGRLNDLHASAPAATPCRRPRRSSRPAVASTGCCRSPDGPANTQVVTWSMSDDVRICRVEVALLVLERRRRDLRAGAGGRRPAGDASGPGGDAACATRARATTSLTYTVPDGASRRASSGSLYKVRVTVTDHAGLHDGGARARSPFYIVRAEPGVGADADPEEHGADGGADGDHAGSSASALDAKLQELADHPRVQGFVVDLDGITDAGGAVRGVGRGSRERGQGERGPVRLPRQPAAGRGARRGADGIHDTVRQLAARSTRASKYLVLVGDDRIIPLARMADRTALLPESTYPARRGGPDAGRDDGGPGAGGEPVPVGRPAGGGGRGAARRTCRATLFLPDLAVGRLVETPEEITTTIATFISQDGVLDLSALDPDDGPQGAGDGVRLPDGLGEADPGAVEGGAGRVDAGRARWRRWTAS